MTTQERQYTVEDLLGMPDDGRQFELINGELIEMPPSSKTNTVLAAWIIHLLISYVVPKELGYVSSPDGGYQISAHNAYQPDAAFISKARAGGLDGQIFPVAPDLAVEIISPSETVGSVNDKIAGYFSAGSQQVWVVYPKTRVVHVYTAVNKVTILGVEDALSGGDVLPGFTLNIGKLFAVLT